MTETCTNCGKESWRSACITYYPCCNKDDSSIGCKFSCCNSSSTRGCTERCTSCGRNSTDLCYARCTRCGKGPGTTCSDIGIPHKYKQELKDRKYEDPKPGEQTAILLIGATGSGKSTIVNALAQKSLATVSHGTTSCTLKPETYTISTGNLVIDTQGTLDSGGKSDEDVWIEIFTHMQQKGCGTIGMVLWLSDPKSRADLVLQTEAKRLYALHPDIFRIVVPIQKASAGSSSSPQVDAVKTLPILQSDKDLLAERARTWTLLESIPVSDPKRAGYASMDAKTRKTFDISTFDEARTTLLGFLPKLKPLKLVFINETCEVCQSVGDRRLLPVNCHKEFTEKHPQTERIHTGEESHPRSLKRKHGTFTKPSTSTPSSTPSKPPPPEQKERTIHQRTHPMDGGGPISSVASWFSSNAYHHQVVIGRDESGGGDWYDLERDCNFGDQKKNLSWRKGNKGGFGGSWNHAENWEHEGKTKKTHSEISTWCNQWIRNHPTYDSDRSHCGVFAKELINFLKYGY